MTKLIKRLAKTYNLNDDAMPNVSKSKRYGQVQFLLHKNYDEKSLSKDSWREMIREIVPTDSNQNLHLDVIIGCTYYNDISEAVYWAK